MSAQRTIGPYQVLGELGRGGMGAVYHARHGQLGYEVALKVLLPNAIESDSRRRRFSREVETLRRLEHPNVVEVLDAGQQGDVPWLALRYVPCETLRDRLKREGPLPIDEVLRLADEIGGALIAAHAAGILHRDLKPDNVLCRSQDGLFLLTDFGLARDEELAESRRLSMTGAMQGTPGFWAPEQAGGEPTSKATDVYGLAATLYAALTAAPPIQASTFVEVVTATQFRPPPPIRRVRDDVPIALEQAVLRGLAKTPEARPASIEALLEAITTPPRAGKAWLPIAAGVAVVLTGAAVVATRAAPKPAQPPARTPITPPDPNPSPAPQVTAGPSPTPSSTPAAPRPTATRQPTVTPEQRRRFDQAERLATQGRFAEVRPLLEALATEGVGAAAFNLGRLHLNGEGGPKDEAQALRWYRRAAELGDPTGLTTLGLFTLQGRHGLKPDAAAAARLFRQAAEQGYAPAMVNLANLLLLGNGVPQDLPQAANWFERAATAGNRGGMFGLAEAYRVGSGRPRDLKQAVAWYRRAADKGSRHAAWWLSVAYRDGGGVARDPDRSLQWLKTAAQRKHPEALVTLGDRYAFGDGVKPSGALAAKHYSRAAMAGSPRGMYEVSRIYRDGTGVGINHAKARRWLSRAAKAGWSWAQLDLSTMLWNGRIGYSRNRAVAASFLRQAREAFAAEAARGEPLGLVGLGLIAEEGLGQRADPTAAARQYRQAAQAGNPQAMFRLAQLHFRGRGVPRDPQATAKWMKQAAELGYAPAQARLATCFELGVGVAPDRAQAHHWFLQASRRGHLQATYAVGHYRNAPGKTRSVKRAIEFLTKAAKRGHLRAVLELCELYAGLHGDPPRWEEARLWLGKARADPRSKRLEFAAVITKVEGRLPK